MTLSWLSARPIAHRGLHDADAGVVENSLAAAGKAIEKNYAIECDVRLSGDGEALVFHDDTLERLTEAEGRIDVQPASVLTRLALLGSDETIPSFRRFLEAVGGRVPLVVELKSRFDGDLALARRVAELIAQYNGPLALKSFDPDPIAFLRAEGARLGIGHVPLGIVARADYGGAEWPELPALRRAELANWMHFARTRPQFLSFKVEDLPHAVPLILRGLRLPVATWTVRSTAQAEASASWADQIVFEGFEP
jgi:glycerophosphoryl diester phosphodiesterase